MNLDPVQHAVTVALAPEDAFELFTRGIGRWWPFSGHSCSGQTGADVEFEPREGGAVTEIAPDGARHPWGVLTAWRPPHSFAMRWHPAQPAVQATTLAVRFTPVPGGCEVAIEHGGFEVRGPEVRHQYDHGWVLVLGCYAKETTR
jgi:Activator of Hsp90 ATPase homolog 1-like protein